MSTDASKIWRPTASLTLSEARTPAPEGETLFVSETCEGEACWCGKPAVRKVGEEFADDEPNPNRHNLTRYICAHHFAELMGPAGARSVGIAPVVPAPEGEAWRTVPVEPTEAMIAAANALWGEGTGVNYVQLEPEDFYAAMLAASPVVPVGVSREEIAKTLFDRHWSAVSASPKWPGEDDDDGSYWLWLADAIIAALRTTDTGANHD